MLTQKAVRITVSVKIEETSQMRGNLGWNLGERIQTARGKGEHSDLLHNFPQTGDWIATEEEKHRKLKNR